MLAVRATRPRPSAPGTVRDEALVACEGSGLDRILTGEGCSDTAPSDASLRACLDPPRSVESAPAHDHRVCSALGAAQDAFLTALLLEKPRPGDCLSPNIVLWLRRFEKRRAIKLRTALTRGGRGLYTPVTLRDSIVPYTWTPELADRWLIAIVTLSMTLGFFFIFADPRNPAVVASAAGCLYALRWVSRRIEAENVRLGTIPVVDKERAGAITECTRLALWITESRARPSDDIQVVAASTVTWRDTVRTLMLWSRCVVIETSEISENVAWERDEALRWLPDVAVILLREACANHQQDPQNFDRCQQVRYACGRRGCVPCGTESTIGSKNFASHLRFCIATALAASHEIPLGAARNVRRPRPE